MRLYNGMKFSENEDRNKMVDIPAKYDQHFLGQTQEFFERFQFNRRDQASGESIDEYFSVLRNMSKACGFCDCMHNGSKQSVLSPWIATNTSSSSLMHLKTCLVLYLGGKST